MSIARRGFAGWRRGVDARGAIGSGGSTLSYVLLGGTARGGAAGGC